MSQLEEHVDICTPLVWVVSDEGHRVTEVVANRSKQRTVYRLDPLRGLLKWVPSDDEDEPTVWKVVLREVPDGIDDDGKEQTRAVIVRDPQVAMMNVIDERGILILEHAHLNAKDMAPFYGAMAQAYLDAVRSDDADTVPAQFILISCTDEVPPEIRRQTFVLHFGLPEAEELTQIYTRLHGVPHDEAQREQLRTVIRAGQGLSELEFIDANLQSLSVHQRLDSTYINHRKIDIIHQSGLLEVRPPSLSVDDIGGLDHMKELIEMTAWTWRHPDEATALDIEPLRRFLLVGVPGGGKSAICEATSSALSLDLAKTGAAQSMSKWVGESEANMRRVFAQVRAMQPITLWIDEFGRDMSGGASSGSVDGGTTDRVHGEFLTGLQELPPQVFLVCAANRIDNLPPEMTRADRFDKIVFVGMPTETERRDIFRIHLGRRHGEYNLNELARITPYFTGAEIKGLVKEVRFRVALADRRAPTTGDFLEYAPRMKGRVWINHHEKIIEMYKRAQQEWDWASTEQEREADRIIAAKPATVTSHTHASAPALSTSSPRDGEI